MKCIFCADQKNFSVFCQVSEDFMFTCWVLSNFKKHVQNYHIAKPHKLKNGNLNEKLAESTSRKEEIPTGIPTNDTKSISEEQEFVNLQSKGVKMSFSEEILTNDTQSVSEEQELVNLQNKNTEMCNDVTIFLKIGPFIDSGDSVNHEQNMLTDMELNFDTESKTDEYENLLYTQLADQNNEMNSAILTNGEVLEDVAFYVNGAVSGSIKVATTKADGSCLFSALAHQLFHEKLYSKQHNDSVKKLREDVVTYIKENRGLFEHEIKGRLYESKSFKRNENFETQCNFFLNFCLSNSRFWGGSESIKAISQLYKVNIIIFNENGSCYIANKFDPTYEKLVAIAFRLAAPHVENKKKNIERNPRRNHYDSVCKIEITDIYVCTKDLMKIILKTEKNTNECIVLN